MSMAEVAADQRTRAVLIQMAQVWFRLAQDHEQTDAEKSDER
jgi:hypothetical protein